MGGMAPSTIVLWALSVLAQIAVFGFLVGQAHFRKLPAFTSYIALNLCQAVFLCCAYAHFGFASGTAVPLFWTSQAVTLLAQALATTEALHQVLRPYRGIWALGWRLLLIAFTAVLCYAAIQVRTDVQWAILAADRGFHFAFASALVACLLLVRYYRVPMHPVYKVLLGGFCFYTCLIVLKNTVFQALFSHFFGRLPHYQEIWDAMTLLPFTIVNVVWAVALRKPLPTTPERLALLRASVYWQISPEVNRRLGLLNDQLSQFWGVGAPRS
jgi:hypothetical protein